MTCKHEHQQWCAVGAPGTGTVLVCLDCNECLEDNSRILTPGEVR